MAKLAKVCATCKRRKPLRSYYPSGDCKACQREKRVKAKCDRKGHAHPPAESA